MTGKLLALNIVFAIADTIIAALSILAFVWCSWRFDKWWIILFAVVPMALFNAHTAIINSDIEEAQKGDENNSES
jgi:hypothetical protein